MTFKFGKGVQEGAGSVQSLGLPMELNLEKIPPTATFEQIAEQLAKMAKIKDGEVEFLELRFAWRKDVTEEHKKRRANETNS